MVDKKKLYRMGDDIQAAIRAGEYDRAVEMLEEFLEQEGADRRWGLSLLQTTLKNRCGDRSSPGRTGAVHPHGALVHGRRG
jgi:hypothetical protein